MNQEVKTMRDVFIEELYYRMHTNKNIFFLCADFGAPKLDGIKREFKDRFINVGIAEQNLINVATGLALEGFTVYAYAIASFLTMRAYEQIRIDLSLQAQLKKVNVNLIGVGAGLSYDVSGPTHHCLEDISIMRTLPNIMVFSPSDWITAQALVRYSIDIRQPKYIRFDGKPLPPIYHLNGEIKLEDGLCELYKGNTLCLVSTGYMTHKAITIANRCAEENMDIGVIDLFMLKPCNEEVLFNALKKYRYVITLEEGFIYKGGMDSLIAHLLHKQGSSIRLKAMGFKDAYVFDIGSREYLHKLNGLDAESILEIIRKLLHKGL